ncbi:hypothetical protein J0J30_23860, partial [Vibrio vulnificus]|nr:hypothetical protein [Vibrio vulnificus]
VVDVHIMSSFSKFNHSRLLRLAELYPRDFSSSDMLELKDQLKTYIMNVQQNENFVNIHGLGDLSKKMVKLDYHRAFHLVY